MEIIDVIQQVSEFLGLDFGGLVASATGITIVVNFLKSTSPFNKVIKGSYIPYTVGGLSLAVSAVTNWGQWLMLAAAVFISILSIGGRATAKMLFHKAGAPTKHKSEG